MDDGDLGSRITSVGISGVQHWMIHLATVTEMNNVKMNIYTSATAVRISFYKYMVLLLINCNTLFQLLEIVGTGGYQ